MISEFPYLTQSRHSVIWEPNPLLACLRKGIASSRDHSVGADVRGGHASGQRAGEAAPQLNHHCRGLLCTVGATTRLGSVPKRPRGTGGFLLDLGIFSPRVEAVPVETLRGMLESSGRMCT